MAFRLLPEEIVREILIDWLPPSDVERLNMTLAVRSLLLKWRRVMSTKCFMINECCGDCRRRFGYFSRARRIDPPSIINYVATSCYSDGEDGQVWCHNSLTFVLYLECAMCYKTYTSTSSSLHCRLYSYNSRDNGSITPPSFWPFVASVDLPPKYQRARYLDSIKFLSDDQ
jgi:hypothetical protein